MCDLELFSKIRSHNALCNSYVNVLRYIITIAKLVMMTELKWIYEALKCS